MSTDWYTKLVLTVVAVCAALILARGFRGDAEASAPFKYQLMPVPMARVILRLNTESGEVWKMGLPELKGWTPVADSVDEVMEEVAPEAGEPEDAPAP